MLPADLISSLAPHLDGALVALDFDGTLAPIVRDPATSRPAPGAIDALTALTARGARIAMITGREARTVLELGSLDSIPGITIAGLYGAESWSAGQLITPPTPASMTSLRARLPDLVAERSSVDGIWVEDKRLSLVIHARTAADPAAALEAVRVPVAELAAELGLEIHDGRDVLEVRLPGYDKGAVLRNLAADPFAAAVLFAGDDLGDLPAFAEVRELRAEGRPAWSVAAAAADVPEVSAAADLTVDGPDGVVALLQALASAG